MTPARTRVLIFGAGIAGRLVSSELHRHAADEYQLVGFIDDHKRPGSRVDRVPILGGQKDLPRIVQRFHIQEIIIAIPSAEGDTIRKFIRTCERLRIGFKIVPKLAEILQKSRVNLQQIREVRAQDLLGREMVTADLKVLEQFLNNRTVLVTGGAGSIGSELCRQIAQFNPRRIILYDWWENGVYELEQEFRSRFQRIDLVPVVGSVQDLRKLRATFKQYRPEFVFHAAAYKHVPLMELHPEEALQNNVIGTYRVALCAREFNVERFILISSDKAVNPTNVMGATKRMAELVIQDMNGRSRTKFSAVRFGNVLASSGSVIPLFQRQIAAGGPVTVTDKRIIRFFMTITEAVQLVLLSAFYGKGGEVFVLDMGEPVRISDLARSLIRASGLIPGKDIKIKYVGLRPGEKLYEETLSDKEHMECIKKDKIYIAPNDSMRFSVPTMLRETEDVVRHYTPKKLLSHLRRYVPTFVHRRDNR